MRPLLPPLPSLAHAAHAAAVATKPPPPACPPLPRAQAPPNSCPATTAAANSTLAAEPIPSTHHLGRQQRWETPPAQQILLSLWFCLPWSWAPGAKVCLSGSSPVDPSQACSIRVAPLGSRTYLWQALPGFYPRVRPLPVNLPAAPIDEGHMTSNLGWVSFVYYAQSRGFYQRSTTDCHTLLSHGQRSSPQFPGEIWK